MRQRVRLRQRAKAAVSAAARHPVPPVPPVRPVELEGRRAPTTSACAPTMCDTVVHWPCGWPPPPRTFAASATATPRVAAAAMASGRDDLLLGANERTFILAGLADYTRADGRFLLEYRRMTFAFERSEGSASAEVTLGRTRVVAVLTASVAAPFPDRPNEGFLSFFVNTPPLAGPGYDGTRQTPATAELARMLERQLRDARALDTEALCITPGTAVWALRADVHVLEDGGNLIDAAALASIGAVLHYRRPDVRVAGGVVTVVPEAEVPPSPLPLHHIPVTVTYGLFRNPARTLAALALTAAGAVAGAGAASAAAASAASAGSAPSRRRPVRTAAEAAAPGGGGLGSRADDAIEVDGAAIVLDATVREEAVADGSLSFVVNAHRELCGIHKLGGCPLPAAALSLCARVAGARAVELVDALKAALADAEVAYTARQRLRHAAAAGMGVPGAIDIATAGRSGAPSHAAAARSASLTLLPDDGASDDDDDGASDGDGDDGMRGAAAAGGATASIAAAIAAVTLAAPARPRLRDADGGGGDDDNGAGANVTELDYVSRSAE